MILAIAIIVFLCFGLVVLRGAPFVVSHRRAVERAMELADLKPGQVMIDLGSGSGTILEAAASRGVYSIGYELNPLLVIFSRLRLWPHRDFTSVRWADYRQVDLPEAEAIYVFLLPRYMNQFDSYIKQNQKRHPLKVISYSSPIPGRAADREDYGLFLYIYP